MLENGASADPNEVAPDANGRLVHKSGVPVAVGPHGPRSRGVDAGAERAKAAVLAGKMTANDASASLDMKPVQAGKGYKTRESKAG